VGEWLLGRGHIWEGTAWLVGSMTFTVLVRAPVSFILDFNTGFIRSRLFKNKNTYINFTMSSGNKW